MAKKQEAPLYAVVTISYTMYALSLNKGVHPLHKLVDEYRTLHKNDVHHSWQQLASSVEPIRVVELLLWDQ